MNTCQGHPKTPRRARRWCRTRNERVQSLIPLRGAGPIDNAAGRPGKAADLVHFSGAELEIEDRDVFGQPFDVLGARNDRGALLDQVAQTDLAGGLAVCKTDPLEQLVAGRAAARDRAIGDDREPEAARLRH